jgi:anti-sigma B factor antagonist
MITVTSERVEGGVVLTPQGRLTVVSVSRLRDAVADAVTEKGTIVVVDLSETTFVDSSGLGALVSGLKSARQAGGDLRLVAPSEQVSMVLRLTNLDRVLQPRASVEEALRD